MKVLGCAPVSSGPSNTVPCKVLYKIWEVPKVGGPKINGPPCFALLIPQQRIRLWGLQSVKQRRGDCGFGSRVPDSVRDVYAHDCRNWIWRAQVKLIYLGGQREISRSLLDGTGLLAQGARSKCAPGVRTQQSFRRNMSLCARREIQVCSQRANAAVLSHEHVCLRTERDIIPSPDLKRSPQ